MRYAPIVFAVALGAFSSTTIAAPMSVPADDGLLSKTGRIEMTDQQLDVLKAGAPNCAQVPNNPNCVTVNPGGQQRGCGGNNPNCTTEFRPGSGGGN